jgi:O-antigen/teichoic acid export membrane protein
VLSQLGNFGLYYSQLHYSASSSFTVQEKNGMLKSGMVLTLLITFIFVAAGWLIKTEVLYFFNEGISAGYSWMLLSLFAFAINKMFLAHMNAMGRIQVFSILQILRYLSIVIFLILFIVFDFPGSQLMSIFFVSETLLLLIISFRFGAQIWREGEWSASFAKLQFSFGRRVFLSGFFQDITSKLDIIILGLLMTSADVGRYTIPAFLAEGLVQICMAILIVVTPQISKLDGEKQYTELRQYLLDHFRLIRKILALVILGVMVFIPCSIALFDLPFNVVESLGIFLTIGISVMFFAPYYIAQITFNQFGHPKEYSQLLTFYAIGNATLNFALIMLMGIWGSAIATALNNIAFKYYFQYLARKTFSKEQLSALPI